MSKKRFGPERLGPYFRAKATSPELLFEKEHLRRTPFPTRHVAPAVDRQPGLRREDSLVGADYHIFFKAKILTFDKIFKIFSSIDY